MFSDFFHVCHSIVLLIFFFKLSINAFDYNCHLDLIKLLRQEGELVKLRRARQKMSELFPLTEGTEHLPLVSQLLPRERRPCKIPLFRWWDIVFVPVQRNLKEQI